ncbi:putative inactive poly [ADP-ribose] polymerase SRO2 [Raphanus sativus]|uniref:Probable inactive poly [ADP-ribose] polymerase SRO2 n=1 Tax=Raphanus sativus TaxID=3726 RepID=A0A6J0JFH9_RAPSA|nr:probable inactive poly [ADP-ribose] polymerase SRO2 [Raphanus sativus]XP_018434384.1 probable inactive poly [ADP-ribose] polymerase SRO2 [Raphanus sativus]KAJ4889694.1 putative inactive poly [ADP-ribose] polymerase SRO2 [Raphanus sativus]
MAAQVEIEDQASITELDNGEILDPLSSSSSDSTILLGEGNQEHHVITKCFLSGFNATLANPTTTIVAIRKKSTNTITTRAKSLAFRIFTEAMARKNGGDPNVKYAWYAGCSREQLERVISYGFSSREIDDDDDSSHGIGIHLVPSNFSLFAAEGTEEDEEGLRHLLLCRLILGKPEEIIPGSKQSYPSSVEFDSGVDDVQNPRKYIVWSSTMNSYIMPTYILTFRSPRLTVVSRGGSPATPSSPRVSFAALVSTLSKSMDTLRMNLIMSTYDDFRKRKIQRDQLVRKVREVAGDNLLAQIIKNHGDKNRVRV